MRTLCRKSFAIGLLVAFLVTTTGRAVPVKAVGTTVVAVAGAATLAVGIGFLSYCALTGMAIHCPNTTEALEDWLSDVGEKVVQFPSGARAYHDVYESMMDEPAHDLLDRAWSWTREQLMDFTNDFSDTRVISNILGYDYVISVDGVPLNGFDYPMDFVSVPNLYLYNGTVRDAAWFEQWMRQIVVPDGPLMVYEIPLTGSYTYINTTISNPVRNVLQSNGTYRVEQFINGTWSTSPDFGIGRLMVENFSGGSTRSVYPFNSVDYYRVFDSTGYQNYSPGISLPYPLFPDIVIYDEVAGVNLPMVEEGEATEVPEWPDVNDPDEEVEYPIVPYTQLPLDVYGGGGNPNPRWQFNIRDLLDALGELGQAIFDLTVLKNFINALGGEDGNIYYDITEEGDTYYNYEYYITNHYNYGDVTYNIDVSDTDEHLPVDLNTIQLYTKNRYVEQFKQSAIAGGSIIRDLVVFWYDVDPEIVYCLFGACILTLIGAFIGKWGHS